MATVDELSVKFGADFRELLAEMRRGEAATAEFRQKVSREMTGARQAFDNVGRQISGVISGALASIQTAGVAAAIGLLTAAFIGLSEGTTKAKVAIDAANAAMQTGQKLAAELATVTGEIAEQKKVEALATIALTESEITRLQIQRDRLLEEERGARSVQTQLSARARGEQIDKSIEKIKEQIRFTRLSIAAGEEAAAVAAGMRTNTSGNSDKPPTSGGTPSLTKGESWIIREAQAAVQAAEALEEYRRRTVDMREIAAAEISGQRERITLIEVEQQLRKQYGTEFVKNMRERIEGYAAERAEVERAIEQQRRLMGELKAVGSEFKGALGESLKAVIEGGVSGAERLRNAWINALDRISDRLLNFALDQVWDMLRQQLKGVSGEGGGWLGKIIGLISGTAGSAASAGAGSIDPNAIPIMDSGGAVSAGVPTLIGRGAQPELFVPNTDGMMYPRGTYGGGTVTLVGSDSDKVEIGQLKAGLSALGIQVDRKSVV